MFIIDERHKGTVTNKMFLLLAVILSGCSAGEKINLPPNIHIVAPGPGVPKELAAFSGKWTGAWVARSQSRQRSRDHVLIVEEIRGTTANVVMAWGAGFQIEDTVNRMPAWLRVTGRFVDGVLRINFPALGVIVTYRMVSNDTIDGSLEQKGDRFTARMTRTID